METACAPACEAFVRAYEACATRIESDETGEAHCTVRATTTGGWRRRAGGRRATDGTRETRATDAGDERLTTDEGWCDDAGTIL